MTFLRPELHGLTGAYALDALDGAERDRFELHLHRCHPCANEVRGFAETATRLALAVASAPPAQLKERVLLAAARTRQLPPETEDSRGRRSALGRAAQRWGVVPGGVCRRPAASWFPRLATVAAAVGLVVAVVLGVTQAATQRQLDRARTQDQAIAAVLAAPDARLVTHGTSAGGVATVVVSRSRHALIVTTSGLPPLPGAKVYELWLMSPGRATPAGLLPSPSGGRTTPVLASGLAAGDRVGLTVEPAGGTRTPTTPPLLDLSLPS